MSRTNEGTFHHIARRGAVALLRLEGAILFALALYLSVAATVRTVTHPGALGAEIAFALLAAMGLYLCSLSYSRQTSWGRSPAVLANLIAIGVSYFMFAGKLYITAIPLLALAAVTLIACLFGYQPDGDEK
jgi:CelD/BcsL family acetyltransferase involved in cellulose biosynthesis